MDLDPSLLELLFDRLARDQVPDSVTELVLAAYTGTTALHTALAGGHPDLPTPAQTAAARPDPLYLTSVTVTGFRGIGPEASLRLAPHPGLTLVVGRNGSGKSSFAEAAELALTGDSARWHRTSVFRDGWRNLHQDSPCAIDVSLRADGVPSAIRVTRSWADGVTDPHQADSTVIAGDRRHTDTTTLGWADPLQIYRPFLTAHDLGRLISSTPSGLFDALAPILGLEEITDADRRLAEARRAFDARVKTLTTTREQLRGRLATVDDDRAHHAADLLTKRRPDLSALDALLAAADDQTTDPLTDACRRLATIPLPEADLGARTADDLDTAARTLAEHTAAGSATAERAAALLESALAYHSAHGDGPCPVCRTGTLDDGWRAGADAALTRLRAEHAATDRARRRMADVREAATTLLGIGSGVMSILDTVVPPPGSPVATTPPANPTAPGQATTPSGVTTAATTLADAAARLRHTLAAWRAMPPSAEPASLAGHLRATFPPLHRALCAVRDAALDWLRQRHDAWREHAAALQEWLADARRIADETPTFDQVKKARQWLREATDELRQQRLAPYAAQSQHIWEQLRQESNVELAGMRLDGTTTRRRVAFPATVDGTATAAMAVMSQGELQALGLAVFLPRACAPASPFRFVIIDDPVHSMDPSKVDGLARVLHELAADRQVVVFTHDDRLPEAVRRLGLPATVWEVLRREGSVVELRKNLDPVRRYLDDANALAKTEELPDEVRRPVVSGFCRSAIEAACHEHIRHHRLHRGETHASVEELIGSAHTLTQTVALALFDDTHAGGKVLPALNKMGAWAADTFRAVQDNVHGVAHGSLPSMVQASARLAEKLRPAGAGS